MSAPRKSSGATFVLLLGIADILLINLVLGPRVFAGESDADKVAATSTSTTAPTQPPVTDPVAPVTDPVAPATDPVVPVTDPATDPTAADDPHGPDDPTDTDDHHVDTEDPVIAEDPAVADHPDDVSDDITDDVTDITDDATKPFRPSRRLLFFGHDRATLKVKHRKPLDATAAELQQYPEAVVYIEGYADKTETGYRMNVLIKRRTTKISRELVKRGVDESRIRVFNRGEGGKAEVSNNRRVRLRVEMP